MKVGCILDGKGHFHFLVLFGILYAFSCFIFLYRKEKVPSSFGFCLSLPFFLVPELIEHPLFWCKLVFPSGTEVYEAWFLLVFRYYIEALFMRQVSDFYVNALLVAFF
jgi:hypothetical protein